MLFAEAPESVCSLFWITETFSLETNPILCLSWSSGRGGELSSWASYLPREPRLALKTFQRECHGDGRQLSRSPRGPRLPRGTFRSGGGLSLSLSDAPPPGSRSRSALPPGGDLPRRPPARQSASRPLAGPKAPKNVRPSPWPSSRVPAPPPLGFAICFKRHSAHWEPPTVGRRGAGDPGRGGGDPPPWSRLFADGPKRRVQVASHSGGGAGEPDGAAGERGSRGGARSTGSHSAAPSAGFVSLRAPTSVPPAASFSYCRPRLPLLLRSPSPPPPPSPGWPGPCPCAPSRVQLRLPFFFFFFFSAFWKASGKGRGRPAAPPRLLPGHAARRSAPLPGRSTWRAMDQASGLDRLKIVSPGGRETVFAPCSAVSGCLWWSPLAAGRGGGMLCRVEVGVEPPCLVPGEQPLSPLGTWGAVPPRQCSCPLARVCLDPPVPLLWEHRVGDEKVFVSVCPEMTSHSSCSWLPFSDEY